MKLKIVTIIGARPQFIKAAVVSRVFVNSDRINEVIIHTGQHFDSNMSDVFFDQMSIPKPDYNLGVNGLSHGAMTGKMLEGIEVILLKEKPDWLLVYGDTNSTLAGALAAKKMGVKVAHVEAGLRSYNMGMPEEINRILTDRISDVLFCPTKIAVSNLNKEGYENISCRIINVGDVMQDAALFYSDKAQKPVVDLPNRFILATIHRAENTDDLDILRSIFESFEFISKQKKIVLPLHPRTKQRLKELNYNFNSTNIVFIEPVGYLEMVYLLKNCDLVMTDSGGVQKEAYFFSKLCITLRNETEWIELVDNGFNIIAGNQAEKIINSYNEFAVKNDCSFEMELYGSGNAGSLILNEILM